MSYEQIMLDYEVALSDCKEQIEKSKKISISGRCETIRKKHEKRIGLENIKAKALENQLNNSWIPCSERLPNEEECNLYDVMHPCHRQFICTVKIGEHEPQTRQLFFSKVFGWKYGPEDYNDCVIAWQPLPSPYKEESK